jgi:hypothetical protein
VCNACIAHELCELLAGDHSGDGGVSQDFNRQSVELRELYPGFAPSATTE